MLAKAVENWPWKVVSIALAIIIFVFHRVSSLEERFFSVPLDIEIKGNLIPASSYPRMIRIALRGDANSIYPILEDDIEAYINLQKYDEPGQYRAPVQIRKKGMALGVEPLEISTDPLDVSLSLDQRVSKFVPLTPSLRGGVAPGFVLTSHSLNPTQVIIDGPSGLMNNVSELYTDFIDLDGRNGDFTVMVNILNRDPLIVIRGNGVTEFHGLVSRIIPVRNITDIPIRINALAQGLYGELDIRSGTVHLEGEDQEALYRFNPPANLLFVDCSEITAPGDYTLEVQISDPPPRGLSFSVAPKTVTILVSDMPEEED
jgi:hypothetical protein